MAILAPVPAFVKSDDDDRDAWTLHPTADEIDRALEDAYWADYWAAEEAADAAIERDLDAFPDPTSDELELMATRARIGDGYAVI